MQVYAVINCKLDAIRMHATGIVKILAVARKTFLRVPIQYNHLNYWNKFLSSEGGHFYMDASHY